MDQQRDKKAVEESPPGIGTVSTVTTSVGHGILNIEELLAGATEKQRADFEENLPFHVGMAILRHTDRASAIPFILFMMSQMFPHYQMDALTSLLYGTSCGWLDEVGTNLLDYDSYFEICNGPPPTILALGSGYLARLPSHTFGIRSGQEYRFTSLAYLASDSLNEPTFFRFLDLPLEIRIMILRCVLVCPDSVLDIDVMHNLCLTDCSRKLPPRIDMKKKCSQTAPMRLNLSKKLAILRTDKRTSSEGSKVFYQENSFSFRSCIGRGDFSHFIQRFGEERAANITSLTITIEHVQFLVVNFLNALPSLCKGVQHLTIVHEESGPFLKVDHLSIQKYFLDGCSIVKWRVPPSLGIWDRETILEIQKLVTSLFSKKSTSSISGV
jgi:hypothetical protein